MKARRARGLEPGGALRPNAARIVRTRLGELRALLEPALDPGAAEAQHDLRIAAKRLRYVLEITGSCFGEEAASARRAARELQQVLGEIHDCDVMLPRAEGIESLQALLRTHRALLFRRFNELAQAQASAGVWSALERSL